MKNKTKFSSEFIYMFIANSINKFGDSVYYIAFNFYIYEVTNSALMVGNSLIFALIPTIFLGPFIGMIVDKYSKKKLMIICDIIRSVLVVLLIYMREYIIVLFIIQLFMGILNQVASISNKTAITNLLTEETRVKGNGLISSMKSLMKILGPTIAGGLIGILNINFVFIINSLSFIISAIIIMIKYKDYVSTEFNDKNKNKYTITVYKNILKDFTKKKYVFNIWISNNFLSIISACNNVLLLAWISESFNETSTIYGITSSVLSAGVLLGSLMSTYKQSICRINKFNIYSSIAAISVIVFSFSNNIILISLTRLILGIVYAITGIILSVEIQREFKDKQLGTLFSFLDMFDYLITVVFIWFYGVLSEIFNVKKIFLVTGIAITVLIIPLILRQITYSNSKQIKEESYEG